MIRSPVLRAVLVVALLGFGAWAIDLVWEGGGQEQGSALLVGLALLAMTAAMGLVFPGRRRIALRAVAAVIIAAYAVYFGVELVALLSGEKQRLFPGTPSATIAGLGLLFWGVPLLIYSISGRTLREHRQARAAALPKPPEVLDEQTPAAMTNAGADLTLRTETNWYLGMPSEGHAGSAANVLGREGFVVEIFPPAAGSQSWACCAQCEMVPSRENVRAMRARMTELAGSLGGEFDGWEAQVRRNETDGQA
jgi:hypothetical protein